MMAYTDTHCRVLHRMVSPSVRLFTEMVTTQALLRGTDPERLLRYHPTEHPLALQLGGSDPGALARCAERAQAFGFDEVNLNVGCPSARVQDGRIGACLMREPELVANALRAMRAAVDIPVTVKHRLGIDADTSEAFLHRFVQSTADAGVDTVYVHARIALLKGLSPAQNRSVPPLDYSRVFALKSVFPSLRVIINGGFQSVADVTAALERCDGVMIGRTAYQQPMLLADLHRTLNDPHYGIDPFDVFTRYSSYVAEQVTRGERLRALVKPVLGLFSGTPGARRFRRVLSDAKRLKANDTLILDDALQALSRRAA